MGRNNSCLKQKKRSRPLCKRSRKKSPLDASDSADSLVKMQKVNSSKPADVRALQLVNPRPIGEWKGRPVFRLKDAQYLDFPYW
jgi:hypothetical protein